MAETAPDILYHYCSLDTFYNIMKNHSIWLSDVTKSNDSNELVWVTRECKLAVMNAFLEYVERLKASGNFLNAKFREFNKITDSIESLDLSKTLKAWVFCLSEKGDNLGQWRGYADDGKGISIGFYSKIFEHESNQENESLDFLQDKLYQFCDKIEYGGFDIKQLLDSAELDVLTSSCEYDELEKSFKKLITYSIILAPLYKNPAFEEEAEWRFGYETHVESLMNGMVPSQEELYFKETKFDVVDYSFTPKNNTLVSHIELKIKDMKSAIASVTIGPKSNLTALDVKLFLVSLGLLDDVKDESIKVSRSSTSYR